MTAEFYTRERCFITELLNDEADPDVSLARCRVEPGVTTELHRLSVAERYVVIDGQGLMHVGEATPYPIGAGDTVFIPAGESQQVNNTGEADLVFFCVCTPRFTADSYQSLEP